MEVLYPISISRRGDLVGTCKNVIPRTIPRFECVVPTRVKHGLLSHGSEYACLGGPWPNTCLAESSTRRLFVLTYVTSIDWP